MSVFLLLLQLLRLSCLSLCFFLKLLRLSCPSLCFFFNPRVCHVRFTASSTLEAVMSVSLLLLQLLRPSYPSLCFLFNPRFRHIRLFASSSTLKPVVSVLVRISPTYTIDVQADTPNLGLVKVTLYSLSCGSHSEAVGYNMK